MLVFRKCLHVESCSFYNCSLNICKLTIFTQYYQTTGKKACVTRREDSAGKEYFQNIHAHIRSENKTKQENRDQIITHVWDEGIPKHKVFQPLKYSFPQNSLPFPQK